MNLKAALKTPGGKLALLVVVVGILVLFAVGTLRDDTVLPEISMAAENIPIPFENPVLQVPNTLPSTWLTMLILIVLGLLYNRSLKRDEPSRLRVAVEAIGEYMLEFMENVGGEHTRLFFPLVATFFLFIAVSNWCGILPGFGSVGVWVAHHAEAAHVEEGHAEETAVEEHGGEEGAHAGEILVPFFRSANAHLSTTLALAILSVGATQYFGFRIQGKSYLGKYFNFKASSPKPKEPEPGLPGAIGRIARVVEIGVNGIVGLLEIALEALKTLPFAFRLFGNIFAGEVLLFVVSYLFLFVFPIVFLGLELFVGLIQALIFSMLTLVFFSMAGTSHHGDESH
ncbi:MAG: F0F1 ATP synthase subunit A [Anaerolineae bacterium]|nr:F0F1 ATP synthase subunit A [Anaerolineae bacterium]